jgi:hypothetical protein
MGYDKTTKLVTKPIDTTDVAAALGVNSSDVGFLCSSEEINMYAKYKPIKFKKWSELTEAEREGMSTDAADNIHFGIQITGPTSGELDSTLSEIHDTEFKYIRPEGGEDSPYRLTDFDKYKHNALPNPGASFQLSSKGGLLEAYFNDEGHQQGSLAGIAVQYDETNIYGVDFTDMLKDTAETLQNALSRAYPCILVTDSRGRSFFTALDYPGDLLSAPAARPLYYNSAYQRSSNWSVRFGKPNLSNGLNPSTTKPWNAPQDGMRATLFLVKSADVNGPYLDIAKTQNFAENWVSLEVGNSYMVASKPIVLPSDAFGAPLVLKRYGASSVYYEPTGVNYASPFLTISYTKVGETDETVTLECRAEIDNMIATKSSQIVPGGVGMVPAFSASDFGMLAFVSGHTYTVMVTITTTDSNGSTTRTGTYNFTA